MSQFVEEWDGRPASQQLQFKSKLACLFLLPGISAIVMVLWGSTRT